MSFTDGANAMSKPMNLRWVAVLLAAGALGGCYSETRISSDYGVAVRQNITASIADPDARYAGAPQPGSNTDRVSIAQRRYVAGRVIPPASTTTSTVSTGGGGGDAAGGGIPPGP
jgi:hypothetical protein